MLRVAKWLAIFLASVIGLLALAIVAVLAFVDPNDHRDTISNVVAEQTGHELVIEGDIGLSFFPWLGLDLGRTRVANPEGFGDEPLAQMDSAGVAVRVLPLLTGELVLDTIRLEGLRANLIVNEAGEANWTLRGPAAETTESTPEPESGPGSGAGSGAGGGLPVDIGTIGGVRVSDLNLRYDNRQTGVVHEAGPVNLQLDDLALGQEVPLTADWVLRAGTGQRLEGDLAAQLRAGRDLQQFNADVTELNLTVFGDAYPDDGVELSLSAALTADLAQNTAQLEDFSANLGGLELNADAAVENLTGNDVEATGEVVIPEANLREVLAALGQEVPETADEEALTRFSLDAGFTADATSAEIPDLTVTLDDTELTGTAAVTDFATAAVTFDLAADRFDADAYLPPGSDEAGASAEAMGGDGEAADGETAEIPLEPLRALNLDGQVRLGELLVGGFELSDIQVQVSAEDGVIRVNPLAASLYQGEYRGDVQLDATGEELVVTANERLTGVQARPIVQQFLGRDLLRGVGSLTLEGRTTGLEPMALVRELVAQAELEFADGAVVGLNLAQQLRNATARLQGNATGEPEERKTDFSRLAGTLNIDGGRIRNDDLQMQSPLFRIQGGGEADILEQTVDYDLTINLVGTLEGQGGESLDRLRGVPIPLTISGSLLSPDIGVDVQRAITQQQRERVREEREQAEERVREERDQAEDEVREEARDQLQRLLE